MSDSPPPPTPSTVTQSLASDPEKLTLGQLFANLTAAQLFAILGVAAGVAGAAFTGGAAGANYEARIASAGTGQVHQQQLRDAQTAEDAIQARAKGLEAEL